MDLSVIKEVRKSKGISQLELAKRLDISGKHINMIENNKATPTFRLFERIMQELEIKVVFQYKIKHLVPVEKEENRLMNNNS